MGLRSHWILLPAGFLTAYVIESYNEADESCIRALICLGKVHTPLRLSDDPRHDTFVVRISLKIVKLSLWDDSLTLVIADENEAECKDGSNRKLQGPATEAKKLRYFAGSHV